MSVLLKAYKLKGWMSVLLKASKTEVRWWVYTLNINKLDDTELQNTDVNWRPILKLWKVEEQRRSLLKPRTKLICECT